MACLMAGAGVAGVFTQSQLCSRSSFASKCGGLSGGGAPESVAPRGLAVRAGGRNSTQLCFFCWWHRGIFLEGFRWLRDVKVSVTI